MKVIGGGLTRGDAGGGSALAEASPVVAANRGELRNLFLNRLPGMIVIGQARIQQHGRRALTGAPDVEPVSAHIHQPGFGAVAAPAGSGQQQENANHEAGLEAREWADWVICHWNL